MERDGHVVTLTMNRPEKKNAMTSDMYVTLAELLDAGLAALRLELRLHTTADAADVTRAWRGILDATGAGRAAPSEALVEPATSGHFYRGLR